MYIKTLIAPYYDDPTQWNEKDNETCKLCQNYLDEYDLDNLCEECYEEELEKGGYEIKKVLI